MANLQKKVTMNEFNIQKLFYFLANLKSLQTQGLKSLLSGYDRHCFQDKLMALQIPINKIFIAKIREDRVPTLSEGLIFAQE
jgi:hypothetical protein